MDARARAVELRAQGLSCREVAKVLGVSRRTVYRWTNPEAYARDLASSRSWKRGRTGTCVDCGATTGLARYGGRTSDRCPACALDAARRIERDTVISLRGEGLSQQEIAHRLNCAQSTVSLILRENGMGVGKGCGPGRTAKLVAS